MAASFATLQTAPGGLMGQPAVTYTLKTGETPESVAKKFSLTLEQLQEFNQFRTFSKSFAQLSAGDEVDVPAANNVAAGAGKPDQEYLQTTTAAQQLGNILSADDSTRQASSLAREMATGAVNQEVQNWMNRFGTARVQASVDDRGSLDGSSLDFLLPLYDRDDWLLFTQLGARNKESRNTLNLGLGARRDVNIWLLGLNVFYDLDWTGHNQRIGVGGEAFRDHIKFSANTYFRLTDWHQSRDFADYNERPANGFDVRAEGWLPAYPQIGGRLMYEQYYGNEVALFGKDNRQKDPYAMTVGVTHTPFPLLTWGAEHRMGKGSTNDSRVTLSLNVRTGESLNSHFDQRLVAAMRTLSGSRQSFVERNSNIVLDYQKQMLIRLGLNDRAGVSGTADAVTAQVTGKYLPATVEWDPAALVEAGGTASPPVTNGRVLNFTYPPYKPGGVNTYIVSAVAKDVKGNTSPRSESVITVTGGGVSVVNSSLAAAPATITADGSSASVITLTLKDTNGNAVSGQTVSFNSSLTGSTTGDVTDNGNGTYTANLTGTAAGVTSVTATVGGNAFGVSPASVTLTADANNLSTTLSTLAAAPATITADGSSASVITLTLKDTNGNAVSGQTVSFNSSLTGSTTGDVTDNGNGTYTANLTGTAAGVTSVTATVGGNAFGVSPASVTLTADANNLSTTLSTLAAAPATITADGSSASVITLTLKDTNGNAVSGQTVSFNSSLTGSTTGDVTDNGNGTYTANLTGTAAGVTSVTATVGGNAFGVSPASVTLTADANNLSTTLSTLAAAPATITADGSSASVITLTLKDTNGNAVSGQTVSFNSSLTGSTTGDVTDNGNGTYTANLTGTAAGVTSVTATVGGNAFGVSPASVTLTADANNLSTTLSTLAAAPATITADGSSASVITLTLKDTNGNAVSGQTVSFNSSLTGSTTGDVTDNGNGTYTANLTGTAAGVTSVTATVGGNAFGVSPASVTLTADAPVPMPGSTTILVNGATFGVNDGFPRNGFVGAEFQIAVSGNATNNSSYDWSVKGASWVGVDSSGKVSFSGTGTSNEVTILATPKTGGSPLSYTFRLNTWFINNGSIKLTAAEADAFCAAQPGGYATPSYKQMTNAPSLNSNGTRSATGQLWSEWGNMSVYPKPWIGNNYWASEVSGSGRYGVNLNSFGRVQYNTLTVGQFVACSKGL
ncbi:invasin domain 3-containing protein [Enterobacter asburiae]|uniref:invasin domain 3-containing protein n=1 Tax=Enterobacter asburiae TaxID=61645 RepID=UPI0021486DEA|nr:invasin domain 3-containing protein [Enterobacter asburiae]UUR73847.1 inverse autotransporter beta domain-containing protein [Enterobacter asburiae]